MFDFFIGLVAGVAYGVIFSAITLSAGAGYVYYRLFMKESASE